MNKVDAENLLKEIRALRVRDSVIDTFLSYVEVEIKAELVGTEVTQDYIDSVIIDRHLLNLAKALISFQTVRVESLLSELAFATSASN